jgi:hypothetical protein
MSFSRRAGYMDETDSANRLLRWRNAVKPFAKKLIAAGLQFWPLSGD